MLLELKVKDFAIINEVHITFGHGLNILSGETGAGKSVLLKSLALLMGSKSSADIVRSGKSQAIVEGCFDISGRNDIKEKLAQVGIESPEELLIVRRLISKESKSRVYINETLTTLHTLQNLVIPMVELAGSSEAPLIEMTSQHESKNLLSKAYHLDMLDKYAGLIDLRGKYFDAYHEWQGVKSETEQLLNKSKGAAQRVDFLRFQVKELDDINLQENEEIELEEQFARTRNVSKLNDFLNFADQILEGDDDSAITRLQKAHQRSLEIKVDIPEIKSAIISLQSALSLIEDTSFSLKKLSGTLAEEATAFEQIQERMADIRNLQRKYGSTFEEIRTEHERLRMELNDIENFDAVLNELNERAQKLEAKCIELASELHSKRKKSSRVFIDSVNAELLELNMKGVQFAILIEQSDLGMYGFSSIEFATQNSKADTPMSLSKAASGGELSRILLSLKNVVGDHDAPRTYLFDEVDTGVSGTTAEKVGKKLKSISEGQQVICVTHLPQVAAFADIHFLINKETSKKLGMQMVVSELENTEKVEEIARLISGEKITKTSLAHAKQLLSEVH